MWKSLLLLMASLALNGCGAPVAPLATAVSGYFGSGGVTLYKKAQESGPKAEFVLVKFEIHHDQINVGAK